MEGGGEASERWAFGSCHLQAVERAERWERERVCERAAPGVRAWFAWACGDFCGTSKVLEDGTGSKKKFQVNGTV